MFQVCPKDCVLAQWSYWSGCKWEWRGNQRAFRKSRTRTITKREVGIGVSCGLFSLEESDACPISWNDGFANCPLEQPNTFNIEGGCFLFNDEKKNYNDAKSFCEGKIAFNGRPGRLVEPKTTTINKLICEKAKIVFGDSFGYFIGVNDISSEGSWVYSSTGLSATTMFDCSSNCQPNGKTGENCADVGGACGFEETWCDRPCNALNQIVCEF